MCSMTEDSKRHKKKRNLELRKKKEASHDWYLEKGTKKISQPMKMKVTEGKKEEWL